MGEQFFCRHKRSYPFHCGMTNWPNDAFRFSPVLKAALCNIDGRILVRLLASSGHIDNRSCAHVILSTFRSIKACLWQRCFTMSCQWASVNSGLLCSSDLVPILCPLSRAVLPGQPSRATFAGAPIHRLWAMSSIVCLIALISVASGPNFLACSKVLRGVCVCSCGTRTRSLSAIGSLPCCRRLRHEHSPVLISQAG